MLEQQHGLLGTAHSCNMYYRLMFYILHLLIADYMPWSIQHLNLTDWLLVLWKTCSVFCHSPALKKQLYHKDKLYRSGTVWMAFMSVTAVHTLTRKQQRNLLSCVLSRSCRAHIDMWFQFKRGRSAVQWLQWWHLSPQSLREISSLFLPVLNHQNEIQTQQQQSVINYWHLFRKSHAFSLQLLCYSSNSRGSSSSIQSLLQFQSFGKVSCSVHFLKLEVV